MTVEEQAEQVRPLADTIGVYDVPSASRPSHFRRVNINTRHCDCFGFISAKKANKVCRHIRAVDLWIYNQLSEVQQRAAESVLLTKASNAA
jgi:hypothetical protein